MNLGLLIVEVDNDTSDIVQRRELWLRPINTYTTHVYACPVVDYGRHRLPVPLDSAPLYPEADWTTAVVFRL